MTDFSANRKKNDLGVLQLNLDMSKLKEKIKKNDFALMNAFRSWLSVWLER